MCIGKEDGIYYGVKPSFIISLSDFLSFRLRVKLISQKTHTAMSSICKIYPQPPPAPQCSQKTFDFYFRVREEDYLNIPWVLLVFRRRKCFYFFIFI